MSNILLTIYPILYLFFIFMGSKRAPKGEFIEEPWNRQQSLMIQALACIGVVLHHVTLRKFSFERNQHHKHGDFSVAWYFLEEHFSWGTNKRSFFVYCSFVLRNCGCNDRAPDRQGNYSLFT